jgi:hypothetical protein
MPFQSVSTIVLKQTVVKLDQPNAVLRKNVPTPLIVKFSLLFAVAAAARLPLIEKGDRLGVLHFPIFYDEFQFCVVLVVGVDRKTDRAAVSPRITAKEVESVLPLCLQV